MSLTQGLCEYDGALYAVWKGETADDRLFASTFDGSSWTPQIVLGGNSSHGPALAVHGSKLVAAWKGKFSDPRLFSLSLTGQTWSGQQVIPGVGSGVGPSLAEFNGALYAAWKGRDDDQQNWFAATADGSSWSPQHTIPKTGTSVGPSLAAFRGQLFAAWKGADHDQGQYFSSTRDGQYWAPQGLIHRTGSSMGPSLCVYGDHLWAMWKGMDGDQALYYSLFDGADWSPQAVVPGARSDVGAAISAFNGRLYAMWKPAGTDMGLRYASFDGASWSGPARIPGNTGQDLVGLRMQYQETSQWCWLAVAASIARFYTPSVDVRQADLMTTIGHAINGWPSTVACSPTAAMLAANAGLAATLADPYGAGAEGALESVGIPQQCIKSGGLNDALDVHGNFAGYRQTMTWPEIRLQVGAMSPVGVCIQWPSGAEHFVVIAGLRGRQVVIVDPANGQSVIDEDDFPSKYLGGATLMGYYLTKAP